MKLLNSLALLAFISASSVDAAHIHALKNMNKSLIDKDYKMPLLETPVNIETIDRDGFKLEYCIEGKGADAIVIGSARYYARSFSQNLRKHLRLIFMDWRAYAQPPKSVPAGAFELEKLVDDVEVLRKKLGLNKIIIIGHSAHGLVALEYAKKYPEHVSHVVMTGISPNLSAANAQAAEQYWQDSVDPERKEAFEQSKLRLTDDQIAKLNPSQRFVQCYIIRRAAQTWYDFNFDAFPLWKDVEPNMEAFDYIYGKVFRDIDITQGLENFDRPVFLGLGRYDFIVAPSSSWDAIRSKFKNLTVRMFEKSGHSPYFEQQDLFDAELLSWLSKN